MPATEEREARRTFDLDPYAVEPTLTLAQWLRCRDEPFVEIVVRHGNGPSN
jgi:hypothetical protein